LDKFAKTIEAHKHSSEKIVAAGKGAAVGAKALASGAAALAAASVALHEVAKAIEAQFPPEEKVREASGG